MKYMIRAAILAGAAAFCIASGSAARADVVRVAVVIADNAADYQANAALLPAFADMLKKGGGKEVHVATDAAHMTVTSVSVFPDAAAVGAVTGSDAWKAEAAKLKSKSYTIGVYDILP